MNKVSTIVAREGYQEICNPVKVVEPTDGDCYAVASDGKIYSVGGCDWSTGDPSYTILSEITTLAARYHDACEALGLLFEIRYYRVNEPVRKVYKVLCEEREEAKLVWESLNYLRGYMLVCLRP